MNSHDQIFLMLIHLEELLFVCIDKKGFNLRIRGCIAYLVGVVRDSSSASLSLSMSNFRSQL